MTNDRTTHDDGRPDGPRDDGRGRPHDAPRTPAEDPRLTAYALGELDAPEDAEARAQVEALLADDAAAREEVARVRELAGTLSAELAAEVQDGPVPTLGASQRAALDAALAERIAGGVGKEGDARDDGREGVLVLRWLPALAAAALVGMSLWAAWDWRKDAAPVPGGTAGGPVASADLERRDAVASKLRAVGYGGDEGNENASRASEAESPFLYDADLGGQGEGGGGKRGDSSRRGALSASGDAEREAYVANGMTSDRVPTAAGTGSVRELPPRSDGSVAMAGRDEAAPATPAPRVAGESMQVVVGGSGQGEVGAAGDDSLRMLQELGDLDADGNSQGIEPAQEDGPSGHLTGRRRLRAAKASAPAVAGQFETLGYVDGAEADVEAPVPDAAPPADAADDDRRADRRHELRYWITPPVPGTESYAPIVEAGFQSPYKAPLSTFSVDVDTASYANVRRFLNQGSLPPKDAVRIEELVNYFTYDYAPPEGGPGDGEAPFATHVAVTECPWAPSHRLVRIGLKGRVVALAERPASNLVFLVDVSGSMSSRDKLPLLVSSLKLLVNRLDERDRVALVTYAGNAGMALQSTRCDGPGRVKVLEALDRLRSGGSTHGSAGIRLAYETAAAAFEQGGVNRVILATDGDFNVGVTDRGDLERLITDSARSGVFLSVLGFGTGNLKDGTAELLADKGNGNYSYIDSLGEAQKVLVHEMGGTLVTIAKDVKLQVEFNPARVEAWRLIGYENRTLAAQDFNDDRKDAGEIGAGHTVTALYEVVPPGAGGYPGVDGLKYQESAPLQKAELIESADLLNVKLRWKEPDADVSTRIEVPVVDEGRTLAQAGPDASFAAAVATFGMLLRDSAHAGAATWDDVIALAERGRGEDRDGYRAEFVRLAQVARGLAGR